MNTLLIYQRMLDVLEQQNALLQFEQAELDKYKAKQLTETQQGYAEKRQNILNDRAKHNDWMTKLTHGLYNLIDEERKEGYRSGYRAASKQSTETWSTDKETIRALNISNAMDKWADHY